MLLDSLGRASPVTHEKGEFRLVLNRLLQSRCRQGGVSGMSHRGPWAFSRTDVRLPGNRIARQWKYFTVNGARVGASTIPRGTGHCWARSGE